MQANNSQAGQTVERIKITDDPHENYQFIEPYTGKELKRGMPLLNAKPGGKVVNKDVSYHTVKCPECEIAAKYTSDSEPVCPECGIICSGSGIILEQQMVRDAKAAGRIEGDSGDQSA
jgi:uncharacterized Zn ribbon protein